MSHDNDTTANPDGTAMQYEGDGASGRRSDGGIYLVVADESEEFYTALRYASRWANSNRAHIGIVHVMQIDDFQHWSNVEQRMRQELRGEAEQMIWAVAKRVYELNGMIPALYLVEGNRNDALIEVINSDPNIRMLVLGAGTQSAGPGPLVNHFTGKGLSRLRVPVMVVPGHLEPQKIDAIA